jgi:hypothetical protein
MPTVSSFNYPSAPAVKAPVARPGYDPTGLSGLGDSTSGFGKWWSDFAKNLGNAFTQHQVGYGAGSSGVGGVMPSLRPISVTPPTVADRFVPTGSGNPSAPGGHNPGPAAPAEPVKDFMYYWNLMNGLTDTGSNWDALRTHYKDSAADVQARTAAMYRALQGQRDTAAGTYGDIRNEAGANIQANADAAAQDIQDAYNNAYQTQADQLAQLGIADTLLASPTQSMMQDAGYNQGLSEKLGSAFANANELGRASDLAYNQDMRGVAGFADAETRANIDQQLLNQLANLDFGQSQENYNRNMSLLGQATGAQALDSSLQPWSPSWDQQQSALDSASQNALRNQQWQTDTYLSLLKQYNGDQNAAQQAYNALMRNLGLA